MRIRLTASLVIYNSAPELFIAAANSFLAGCEEGVLVISDNSDTPLTNSLIDHPRVWYIYNNANLGFGAAHNRAFDAVCDESDLHLILNPDITFGIDVIPHLVNVMQEYPEIGAIMPRINYLDGSLQRLCKLLPTPVDLIFRRFIPINAVQTKINHRYELNGLPQDLLIDSPTISGCFLFVRTELLRTVGAFDERYFMYMEDVDLVRRLGDKARVVYEPRVSVTHAYAKGSYQNRTLLLYHVTSAVRYFNKWGWWFDSVRRERNAKILSLLQKM